MRPTSSAQRAAQWRRSLRRAPRRFRPGRARAPPRGWSRAVARPWPRAHALLSTPCTGSGGAHSRWSLLAPVMRPCCTPPRRCCCLCSVACSGVLRCHRCLLRGCAPPAGERERREEGEREAWVHRRATWGRRACYPGEQRGRGRSSLGRGGRRV
uniref:Uncharacterized protein n=1 Tax=Triticum urartu TaxID=4572 RepID=A0A8R7UYW5_TRIUA